MTYSVTIAALCSKELAIVVTVNIDLCRDAYNLNFCSFVRVSMHIDFPFEDIIVFCSVRIRQLMPL